MADGFAQVAPYLRDPLVLVGFFVFLFFGFGRLIIKSQLLPKLTQRHGYRILHIFLLYGFLAGLLIILLGFGLKYRELSRGEQGRVLAMLSREADANARTVHELARNSETLLNLMSTLATTLRHPGVPLLSALFPIENIQDTRDVVAAQEMARSVFAGLERSELHQNPSERARFAAAGRLVSSTVRRTLSTVDSLSDSSGSRYRIHEEVWRSELPVLRKVDTFSLAEFQESYSQLKVLRSNYDVIARHVRDYMVALEGFLSGDHPISEERLVEVLSQERLAFSVVADYGQELATAAERLEALQGALPGQSEAGSVALGGGGD